MQLQDGEVKRKSKGERKKGVKERRRELREGGKGEKMVP